MAKKLRVGSLLVNKRTFSTATGGEVERTLVSIGLGNMRNKDPKYNLSVEVIVTDNTGKVVHSQKNGFLSLVDPRSQPDELLAAGIINEEQYADAKARVAKIPENIKYSLEIPVRS